MKTALTGLTFAIGLTLIPTTAFASTPHVLTVYDEAVRNDFTSYSSAPLNFAHTQTVHSGKNAIEMQVTNSDALYLYKDRVALVSQYDTLQFYIHGGTTGGQQLKLTLQQGGLPVWSDTLSNLLPHTGGVLANQWVKVELNLAALNLPNGLFDGILLQGTTATNQGSIYLDDIQLYQKSSLTEPEQAYGMSIFQDYLNHSPKWSNFSWMEHNVNNNAVVHTGLHAIEMKPDRDRSLYFYKDRVANFYDYRALRFWVNGGAAGGQQLKVVFLSGGRAFAERHLNDLLPAGIPANEWVAVEVPTMFGYYPPTGVFDGVAFVGTTTGVQPTLYLDDVSLVSKF